MGLALALATAPTAAHAQWLTTFTPAAPALRSPRPAATLLRPDSAAPGHPFRGSFIGATLGAGVGWVGGAGLVLLVRGKGDNFVDAFDIVIDAALAGMVGAIVVGGVGSRVGARAAGGQGGPWWKHMAASAGGFMASMFVTSAALRSAQDPSAALVLGTAALSQGLVTAVLAPK
jgi:hypothetical protein